MTSSPKFISFLFLFALVSIQSHARDGLFFTKVSRDPSDEPQTTATGATSLANKEAESLNKEEQGPSFFQTQNSNSLDGNPDIINFNNDNNPDVFNFNNEKNPVVFNEKNPDVFNEKNSDVFNFNNEKNPDVFNFNNDNKNNGFEEQQQSYGETSLKETSFPTTTTTPNSNDGTGYLNKENNNYPNQYQQNPKSLSVNSNNNNEISSDQENSEETIDEQYVPGDNFKAKNYNIELID